MLKNKNTRGIITILLILFSVLMFYLILKDNYNKKTDINNNAISSENALVICQTYYEELYEKGTGFDAKIGILSDFNIIENDNTWILNIYGKCQNAFGAWMHIPAKCVVRKKSITGDKFNYANIVEFNFER